MWWQTLQGTPLIRPTHLFPKATENDKHNQCTSLSPNAFFGTSLWRNAKGYIQLYVDKTEYNVNRKKKWGRWQLNPCGNAIFSTALCNMRCQGLYLMCHTWKTARVEMWHCFGIQGWEVQKFYDKAADFSSKLGSELMGGGKVTRQGQSRHEDKK